MADLTINAAPVTRYHPIDTQALGKTVVDSKQAMSTGSVGLPLDAQVLPAGTTTIPPGYTVQQIEDIIDKLEALVEKALQARDDAVKSSPAFDPGELDKHILVLLTAIKALKVALQASAAMSGTFTQIAFKAAQAQGVAIKAGGEAARSAALGGAVGAGAMAIGGAGTQIRGHQMQHTDIKTNKIKAATLNSQVQEMRAELKQIPFQKIESSPTKLAINRNGNELDAVQLKNNEGKLFAEERAVLELEIRNTAVKAKDAGNASALNQKAINSRQVVGSTLSSMSHIVSSAVTSTLRVEESIQQQKGVLHQAEHNVNKSVSDAANQVVSEDTAMLAKQLEILGQVIESHQSTINTIANARA